MKKYFMLLSILILFSLTFNFISASNIQNPYSFNTIDLPFFDNNTAFVNSTISWVTPSLGILTDVNATQHENNGGTLNIKESWLTIFWNKIWDTKDTDDLPEGSINLYDNQSWNQGFANSLYCELVGGVGCTMTGPIDMGNNPIINIPYLQFNLTATPTHEEGRMHWNINDSTMEIGMAGSEVNLQVGQELLLRATNDEGSTIENCKAVYISGATGNNPNIKLASNSPFRFGQATIGISTEEIPNGQKGYATTYGLVRECNTTGFVAGRTVFLGINGEFLTSPPNAPSATVSLGVVTRVHGTEGVILAGVTIQPIIEDLSDVNISSADNRDILMWNSTLNIWQDVLFDDLIRSIEYNASNIVTIDGTLDSGDLASVLVRDDGNSYNVSEDSGANPLTIIINFTGVENFNIIQLREWYAGGSGHTLEVGVFICAGGGYDSHGTLTDMETWGLTQIDEFNPAEHICGLDKNVSIRIKHLDNGIPSHDFFLDSIHLIQGASVSSPTEVDPFAIYKDGSVPWEGNEDGGGGNSTNWDLITANNISTTTLDNGGSDILVNDDMNIGDNSLIFNLPEATLGAPVVFSNNGDEGTTDTIITSVLTIKRLTNDGQIFNSETEVSKDDDSPNDTEWNSQFVGGSSGYGDLGDVTTRTYDTFINALDNRVGNNILGEELVMHVISVDRYYKVLFDEWGTGEGGGGGSPLFSYTRTEIIPPEFRGINFGTNTLDNNGWTGNMSINGILKVDEVTDMSGNGINFTITDDVVGGFTIKDSTGTKMMDVFSFPGFFSKSINFGEFSDRLSNVGFFSNFVNINGDLVLAEQGDGDATLSWFTGVAGLNRLIFFEDTIYPGSDNPGEPDINLGKPDRRFNDGFFKGDLFVGGEIFSASPVKIAEGLVINNTLGDNKFYVNITQPHTLFNVSLFNVTGNITSNTYFGDGSQLIGIISDINDTNINVTSIEVTGNITGTHLFVNNISTTTLDNSGSDIVVNDDVDLGDNFLTAKTLTATNAIVNTNYFSFEKAQSMTFQLGIWNFGFEFWEPVLALETDGNVGSDSTTATIRSSTSLDLNLGGNINPFHDFFLDGTIDLGTDTIKDGNWTTFGNITADTYFGDGSQLTGIDENNNSWNQSFATSLYLPHTIDTWKLNITNYYTRPQVWNVSELLNGTLSQGEHTVNGTNINVTSIFSVGNITTEDTGFFSWLGSLANRITKLWVQDIDASGDINVTGNITLKDTICFTSDCSAKMYHNGSGIIISS